ncbi:hypothetical protein CDD80_2182 [Ophiocordyceps camponoti-rufipedis]|uniref:Uncharacterized protein n=1 Tax=Ophiocordyceps camponoti-rufipedis TaxID=2004952 RepID=A0A2C5X6V9_9HYPO|nr:hypothetical protein CDD80_2182 [Ophiocordyceps camponoti-rufipedis]
MFDCGACRNRSENHTSSGSDPWILTCLSTTPRKALTLLNESPPFPPHSPAGFQGAPTQSNPKNSSTPLKLPAQAIESVWKTSSHSTPRSTSSNNHLDVKNRLTISSLPTLMFEGSWRSVILSRRWRIAAEAFILDTDSRDPRKRKVQLGGRTAEKCSRRGARWGRGLAWMRRASLGGGLGG